MNRRNFLLVCGMALLTVGILSGCKGRTNDNIVLDGETVEVSVETIDTSMQTDSLP